jgi:hypothetical protein
MALDREAIWVALTDRVRESLSDVKSVERRARPQYTDADLPAVVIADDEGQEAVKDPEDPAPVWTLGGEILLLARTSEVDPSPSSQLNDLVKAICEALEFDATRDLISNGRFPEHYTNLGGLVRAFAVTKVDKFVGALSNRPTAQLTITMEALG